jgi:hypothetical protein
VRIRNPLCPCCALYNFILDGENLHTKYNLFAVTTDREAHILVLVKKHSFITVRRSNVSPGWVHLAHPEGKPYFFHEEKVRVLFSLNPTGFRLISPYQNALTDEWMYDSEIADCVNHSMIELRTRWNEENWEKDGRTDFKNSAVVLQLTEPNENGQRECEYYFVNHKHRIIMWAHEVDDLSWYLYETGVDVTPKLLGT